MKLHDLAAIAQERDPELFDTLSNRISEREAIDAEINALRWQKLALMREIALEQKYETPDTVSSEGVI